MVWHRVVFDKLQDAELFTKVELIGGKVRAMIDGTRFLDIHYDPTNSSYSYALIDRTLGFSGDKRLLGWVDFPHGDTPKFQELPSHPHHFQRRVGET